MILHLLLGIATAFVLCGMYGVELINHRSPPGHDTIDVLLREAEEKLSHIMSRQTESLDATIQAYRVRRNQEPPKGFDQWYTLASKSNAILVEDMWDSIYEDLEAYRGTPPLLLQAQAHLVAKSSCPLISGFFVRSGNVTSTCEPDNFPCLEFQAMIGSIARWLPDMSIPVNGHASPRLIVPYVNDARSPHIGLLPIDDTALFTVPANTSTVWSEACPPSTPLGQSHIHAGRGVVDVSSSEARSQLPEDSWVSNTRTWRDVCQQPWLLKMHGALVRPNALNISQWLLPIFAPAKVSGIETAMLYPDTIYWAEDPDYHANVDVTKSWKSKSNKAFWRGSNTGGGHGPDNWHQFHRHRFVASTNASYLRGVKHRTQRDWVGFPSPVTTRMIQITEEHIDTGFNAIGCRDDRFRSTNGPCSYLDEHFHAATWEPLATVLSSYRYLFDIDGNSYSGRFRTLLLSESVVLKATIFREWHDDRLIPWLHFVPLTNHFGHDLWDVLDYLLDHEDKAAHIARSARSWALRVMRREDMELYLLRLLLEWARLTSLS
jgi:hypothetical protein